MRKLSARVVGDELHIFVDSQHLFTVDIERLNKGDDGEILPGETFDIVSVRAAEGGAPDGQDWTPRTQFDNWNTDEQPVALQIDLELE